MTMFLTEATANPNMAIFGTLAMYAILFGGIYFLLIRPQKKRENQVKEAQSKLKVGDEVMLTNGIFGKILDIGEDVFVLEIGLNKGVRIPVKKESVLPSEGYKL